MKKWLVCFLLAAASGSALADDWIEIAKDTDQTSYINPLYVSDIDGNGNISSWIKYVFKKPIESKKIGDFYMILLEVDCGKSKSFKIAKVVSYSRSGRVKSEQSFNDPKSSFIPGTRGAAWYNASCLAWISNEAKRIEARKKWETNQ